MKTNYYRAIGVLILWTILIVNMNMELAIWEKLFAGMGMWFISQEKELGNERKDGIDSKI